MKNRPFTLWHSLAGTAALVILEALFVWFVKGNVVPETVLLIGAIIGMVVNIYVAAEVIEEVRGARNMFVLLSIVVSQLVVFFAFQYAFLYRLQPASFPTLPLTALSFLLNSVMIFVFNPLYVPATDMGRALMLINTLGGLVLVLFVLQNISELRRKSLDTEEKRSLL